MKKLSLLLVLAMLLTSIAVPAMATEGAIKESSSGFFYIEANGDQAKLSAASADKFIQADGLYFKDLNGNGALDVYEDYRKPVEERVADLLGQMTINEKAGTLFFSGIGGKNGTTASNLASENLDPAQTAAIPADSEILTSHEIVVTVNDVNYSPMAYQIQDMGVTTFIAAMTGTPKDQLDLLNNIQKIAEGARLGIPAVFSGDRSYNTWGGMIDMPHYALGVAGDTELLYNLVSEYSKESVALGYHQVFHGYGNEIGSWYGDDPTHIAEMSEVETRAYDDWGFNSHSKHFIARGGRSSYVNAKSPADLIDSWMVGWQAVVDAGTQWIMCNNNVGITPGLQGYMDKETYDGLLRGQLGYEGIVCLDWPMDISSLCSKTGITSDGIDVTTLTPEETYALVLNAGVDMFSALGIVPGTDIEAYNEYGFRRGMPDVLVNAVAQGVLTEEEVDEHVYRVLKNKFDLGIFEDPYSDWEEALALIGTEAYVESGLAVPMTNEEINLYRRPEITAMEEEVMVKSTILFKNDGVLPLADGVKIYADSNNATIKEAEAAALAAKATLVETMEEADVIIYHATAFDENYDYLIEDAAAAGDKPVVVIFEGTNTSEPGLAQAEQCAAVLMQTYKNTPDHGSSVGSFWRYVNSDITVDMLFGVKEPAGSSLYEIGYGSFDKALSWAELQDDIGVDNDVRLYMAMLAKENPTIEMPNNLGDVVWTTNFGMNYTDKADIALSLLTVPRKAETVTTENNGRVSTSTVITNAAKAGIPFEVNFVAKNSGAGDGHITAEILVNDAVAAEKFIALDAGQWRVISVELTLEAGEYTIAVGDLSTTIVVE